MDEHDILPNFDAAKYLARTGLGLRQVRSVGGKKFRVPKGSPAPDATLDALDPPPARPTVAIQAVLEDKATLEQCRRVLRFLLRTRMKGL